MSKLTPYTRSVQYYETDAMAIVHHSNYIRWFEEARVDFMRKMGYPYERVAQEGLDFPLYHADCQYKSPARFADVLKITVKITELTHAKMTVEYEIVNTENGQLLTTGATKHYFYDSGRKRLVSLKKACPELFELFVKHMDASDE